MFIYIGTALVNSDHIISCKPNSNVVTVKTTDGERFNIPEASFNVDILPILKPNFSALDISSWTQEVIPVSNPVVIPEAAVIVDNFSGIQDDVVRSVVKKARAKA